MLDTRKTTGEPDLGNLAVSLIELLGCAREQVDRNGEAAKGFIARASTLLQVEIERSGPAAAGPGTSGALSGWQIKRVRTYIDNHLQDVIHVDDISTVAKLSATYFSRAFKRTFGLAPHAYIVRLRLERASHLMLTTDNPLIDIALACGFSDQAHLCKLFRQGTGQSPAAWRRERRERPVAIKKAVRRYQNASVTTLAPQMTAMTATRLAHAGAQPD